MKSSADLGRQLEQRMATFFESNGYLTRCNEIREGRSGGRHEIDVLAEKSDALTTYRVAVECKAWQHPIEKDVVAKLHYVLGDLGLNKGIVVSLAGCRSGAARAAADLGIELWGPEELRRHIGEAELAELGVPPATVNSTLAWGYAFRASALRAEKVIRASGKGRLGLRTLEHLTWLSPVWLPAYSVRLTVALPEVKRLKTRLRSITVDNIYEALSGTFIGRVPGPWDEVQIDQSTVLWPTVRDTKVHAALRAAVQDRGRVSSPSAVQRHAGRLSGLGLPANCEGLSVDHTALVHLPYHVGILDGSGGQRAVAVAGRTGQVSDLLSHVFTANLADLRRQVARAPLG